MITQQVRQTHYVLMTEILVLRALLLSVSVHNFVQPQEKQQQQQQQKSVLSCNGQGRKLCPENHLSWLFFCQRATS